jgi:hypothetical protein
MTGRSCHESVSKVNKTLFADRIDPARDELKCSARFTQAGEILDGYLIKRPKCIVLDLDYTVWPFW